MTIGEVGRRLTSLTATVAALDAGVREMSSRDRADLLRFEQHDRRIGALETIASRLTWTVVLAVIGAVLMVVIPTAGR